MNASQDLNIEEEILPLFDHTLNYFSKQTLLDLIKKPLGSTHEIHTRQRTIRGFEANKEIVNRYSYSISYLLEVHEFLQFAEMEDLNDKKLIYRFFTSAQKKAPLRSKLIQLILLFHKLESTCFSRLDLSVFPEAFQTKIKEIMKFLSSFHLEKMEERIREYQLRDHDIIDLTGRISGLRKTGETSRFWKNLFFFEALLSVSASIQKRKFTLPEISESGITLKEFYHPLIDHPVKNDFQSDHNVVLLNGPNMSGKSTLLRAISLCVYLGNVGVGIPAATGRIPFISNFSVNINSRDDLLSGYSHFMTEIMKLKEVIQGALNGQSSFAVFDELFSGTNVEDAFEISKTTLKGLTKFKNSIFFISSHIQELKEVNNQEVATYFIGCKLIENKPVFTYELKKGWSDIKIGRVLFEKEGLNALLS